jgi:hypothetical protein
LIKPDLSLSAAETFGLTLKLLGMTMVAVSDLLQDVCAVWKV